MEKAAAQPSGEVCHRCLQPVAQSARRCPHCGERRSSTRRLPILIEVLGLLALVFVAIIMVKAIRNSHVDPTPADETEQSAPQPPDKPPPFNP
jgi:DNA-directed RNA polymerase subunit RPC12/RpoP